MLKWFLLSRLDTRWDFFQERTAQLPGPWKKIWVATTPLLIVDLRPRGMDFGLGPL